VIGVERIALPHGITLECRRGGQGPKRVMLLHGFPEAAFIWDEVIGLLAADAHGIAPNLRGYAGSSAPGDTADYRARHLIADLVALIDATGGPLDLLVAHDWGGAVAWGLAAQRPGLLKRLMIINSPHPATFLRELRESREQIEASAYMNWLCQPDAVARLREDDYARLWPFFADEGGAEPAWMTAQARDRYREAWATSLAGGVQYYRASPLRPAQSPEDPIHTLVLPDEAVTVRVPTTILWGEADRALRPGLLRGIERWVPDLTLTRVPDASHWLIHERPALVADTARGLLRP
jgi:pimeloyl-ACP methyl ester carboxylesterase